MQPLALSHLLFISLGAQVVFAASTGVCLKNVIIPKQRHVMDHATHKWKIQTYSESKTVSECCPGYKPSGTGGSLSLRCEPVCDPVCKNAVCEAPDTCVCLPGHTITNISNTTCYDICDSCVNGVCGDFDSECTCFEGYQRDSTFKHVCNPVCSNPCVNATCTAPDVCDCIDKFEKDPSDKNVCVPTCTNTCVLGECIGPDECSCLEGYINDEISPNVCVPVCTQNCEQGLCVSPDTCKCLDGFQPHPRNPFRCFPDNSTLTFCELKLPTAIKYRRTSDCFVVKESVLIKSDIQCQPLDALLQPTCSQVDSCSLSSCNLNFRCSVKVVNGSKEMHCDLGLDDFVTEESTNITITDSDDWIDIVLVLNSFQQTNMSTDISAGNQWQEWNLRPSSKWAVCGQNHFFGLQVCRSTSNSSSVFWIVVYLALAVLLLTCSAVGVWFYWTKHRRLNDPLNYRGNGGSRGYFNPGYEHPPSELLPLDAPSE